jgi:DNA-binding winged helix-turn-helix (wHTH) protein/hemoglobin-like flavoprotein
MEPLRVRFGDCVLDEPRRELLRGGVRVPVQPKVLEVLIFLVRHRDRAVSREDIFDAVWPDVVVGSSSLSRAIREVRKAIGDEGGGPEAIRTLARHGFRFVAPVEEVSPPSPEAPAPASRRVAAVGRAAERGWLEAGVERARRGRTVLRLIVGEPGLGKTYLLDGLVASVSEGACVLRGRVSQAEAGAPLVAFREVAYELGLELDEGPEDEGLASCRRRRLLALRSALKSHAEGRTIVLAIDDVDRADASSFWLLEDLLEEHDGLPLCMVVTLRTSFRRSPALARTLSRALRDDPDAMQELLPLRLEELAPFVAALVGRDPTPEAVAAVHRLSGGHPLFARHLVHSAVRAGRPLESIDLGSLPRGGGLRELVLSYVDDLAPATRELLEAASILRLPFSADLVAEVADARPAAAADAMKAAVDAGLLEPAERGRLRFVHEIVREVVSESLMPSRATSLHRRAARGLERRLGTSPEHLELLTLHYVNGAPDGDADRALSMLRTAAQHALRAAAFDVASRHLATALDVEAMLPPEASRRAALYLDHGKALARGGHVEEAAAAFSAADPEHWQGEASALQAAFHAISSVLPRIVSRFYELLFTRHPQVQPLFKSRTPDLQQRMFGETLVALVEHADDAVWFEEHVTALGRRHARYDVEDAMYDWVREAFLDAIGEASGREGLPDVVRATWARTYDAVAERMKVGTRAALAG